MGDVDSNLAALSQAPEPKDGTAKKIWKFLREGWDRPQLIQGVQLLAQIRCSTTVVEQGHGSVVM
eukprot:370017-Lingulodinium_polyedra.AAC.1